MDLNLLVSTSEVSMKSPVQSPTNGPSSPNHNSTAINGSINRIGSTASLNASGKLGNSFSNSITNSTNSHNNSNSNSNSGSESANVRVIIRARPSLAGSSSYISNSTTDIGGGITINHDSNSISVDRDRKGVSVFTFSKVLDPSATQQQVFDNCNVVNDVLNGYSCCVLAYGQTGSGKTYSIYGKDWNQLLSLAASKGGSNQLSTSTGGNNSSLSNSINGSMANAALVDDIFTDSSTPTATSSSGNSNTNNNTFNNSSSSGNISIGSSNFDKWLESSSIGILPRSLISLFSQLEAKSQALGSDFEYSVTCQVIQVYNDKIFDCISDKKHENPLSMRDDKLGNTFIKGLSTYPVFGHDDVFQLIKKTIRNRVTRATDMNRESSRSHMIVQLLVETSTTRPAGIDGAVDPLLDTALGVKDVKKAVLSFVDLAGSEKWKSHIGGYDDESGGESAVQQGVVNLGSNVVGDGSSNLTETNGGTIGNNTNSSNVNSSSVVASNASSAAASLASIQEMTFINQSLSTLGLCLASLVENQNQINRGNLTAGQHVPYRSSTLTRVLKNCLGGSCRVIMLATIYSGNNISESSNGNSNLYSNKEETIHTLQFSSRLKSLKYNVTNSYNSNISYNTGSTFGGFSGSKYTNFINFGNTSSTSTLTFPQNFTFDDAKKQILHMREHILRLMKEKMTASAAINSSGNNGNINSINMNSANSNNSNENRSNSNNNSEEIEALKRTIRKLQKQLVISNAAKEPNSTLVDSSNDADVLDSDVDIDEDEENDEENDAFEYQSQRAHATGADSDLLLLKLSDGLEKSKTNKSSSQSNNNNNNNYNNSHAKTIKQNRSQSSPIMLRSKSNPGANNNGSRSKGSTSNTAIKGDKKQTVRSSFDHADVPDGSQDSPVKNSSPTKGEIIGSEGLHDERSDFYNVGSIQRSAASKSARKASQNKPSDNANLNSGGVGPIGTLKPLTNLVKSNLQNSKTSKRLKKLNKKLSKLKAISDQSSIQNLVTANNSVEAGNTSSELAQGYKIKLSPLKRGKELSLYDDATKGSEGKSAYEIQSALIARTNDAFASHFQTYNSDYSEISGSNNKSSIDSSNKSELDLFKSLVQQSKNQKYDKFESLTTTSSNIGGETVYNPVEVEDFNDSKLKNSSAKKSLKLDSTLEKVEPSLYSSPIRNIDYNVLNNNIVNRGSVNLDIGLSSDSFRGNDSRINQGDTLYSKSSITSHGVENSKGYSYSGNKAGKVTDSLALNMQKEYKFNKYLDNDAGDNNIDDDGEGHNPISYDTNYSVEARYDGRNMSTSKSDTMNGLGFQQRSNYGIDSVDASLSSNTYDNSSNMNSLDSKHASNASIPLYNNNILPISSSGTSSSKLHTMANRTSSSSNKSDVANSLSNGSDGEDLCMKHKINRCVLCQYFGSTSGSSNGYLSYSTATTSISGKSSTVVNRSYDSGPLFGAQGSYGNNNGSYNGNINPINHSTDSSSYTSSSTMPSSSYKFNNDINLSYNQNNYMQDHGDQLSNNSYQPINAYNSSPNSMFDNNPSVTSSKASYSNSNSGSSVDHMNSYQALSSSLSSSSFLNNNAESQNNFTENTTSQYISSHNPNSTASSSHSSPNSRFGYSSSVYLSSYPNGSSNIASNTYASTNKESITSSNVGGGNMCSSHGIKDCMLCAMRSSGKLPTY